ncbi:MAG: hypothetical protein K0R34_517 [Herbinix sp.]|jgi:putative ABC transport system permease protein|nr:hypothetical protein [Herbinix sp.]
MLRLKDIFKDYKAGDTTVNALKEINLTFRKNEFVSILGPSGCGKTTLLNIIGGLDRYSSGDLSINLRSTREFKDSDWDTYRNHSIGFVFQTYNLIPHQTVLSNVELAMTLSGVTKSERKARATEALTKVGLADQLKKKPNQLSGGQMQRVAIARSLVNNPDILLADEPTGALDSETSVQIMEILKEISKDRLIIMVTHNPDLAERYSTRIIRLLDGKVDGDTNPYQPTDTPLDRPATTDKATRSPESRTGKTSMSFMTALSLSLNNLMTKKTRTFMTAFAGSIGIIGIALILAMSNGIQTYIDKVQEDTLSSYPITIQRESMDLAGMFRTFAGESEDVRTNEPGKVYSSNTMSEMMNTMVAEVQTNNLEAFKKYIESEESGLSEDISSIKYHYKMNLNVYKADTSKEVTKINPSSLFDTFYGDSIASDMASQMSSLFSAGVEVWEEMLSNQALLSSQYDVLAGSWPENYNEVVLIIDDDNEISDMVLYALGLKDMDEVQKIMEAAMKGETFVTEASSYSYEELLNLSFKLVVPADYYKEEEDGSWSDIREDIEEMKRVVDRGTTLKLVGILKPNEDAVSTSVNGSIGYTKALTDYVIKETNSRKIVKQQLAHPDIDIFTGIPFKAGEEEETLMTMEEVESYLATLDEETQAQMTDYMSDMTEEQILEMFAEQLQPETTLATYDENVELLDVVDFDKPETMNIYASTFEAKNNISDHIDAYNDRMNADGKEEYVINYTDIVGLMMSSISSIINVISYVLIAFVAISLVVSSIMIGIITYISVLERTKEIGILRSVGASKRDISRVFNAETLIVGFVSGALGIIITFLLTFPANSIIHSLTGISGVKAILPVEGAIILVIISMILTLIAGLIPSRLAAKKDPVVALRTE